MNNTTVSFKPNYTHLDAPYVLHRGDMLLLRSADKDVAVFIVVEYKHDTHINNKYCSLINIETGDAVCDEPISKATVERRILNHILRLGKPGQKAYNLSIPSEKYADFNLVFIGRNRRDINIEVRDYE